jgi:hypothetical protein
MPIGNGGIIGPANDPTDSVASGVWSLNEQFLALLGNNWPLGVRPRLNTSSSLVVVGVVITLVVEEVLGVTEQTTHHLGQHLLLNFQVRVVR